MKLWLICAFVVGCGLWVLSQSTVVCDVGPGLAGAGQCVATSMAHGFAPFIPWVLLVIVGLTVAATVRFALRRR